MPAYSLGVAKVSFHLPSYVWQPQSAVYAHLLIFSRGTTLITLRLWNPQLPKLENLLKMVQEGGKKKNKNKKNKNKNRYSQQQDNGQQQQQQQPQAQGGALALAPFSPHQESSSRSSSVTTEPIQDSPLTNHKLVNGLSAKSTNQKSQDQLTKNLAAEASSFLQYNWAAIQDAEKNYHIQMAKTKVEFCVPLLV